VRVREIGRGLGVNLWITLVLIAYDIARVPASAAGHAGLLPYLGETIRLGLLTYFPLFLLVLLSIAAAVRVLPGPLRARLRRDGALLSLDVACVVTVAVISLALAALGESRVDDGWWSPPWLFDLLFVAAGSLAAGWGAGAAARRAASGPSPRLGISFLSVLPLIPPLLVVAPSLASMPASGIVRGGAAARSDLPDIVLIVADTLRSDALGCYGNTRIATPSIDALAASGARFADVTAQASWTNPSTATILTSWYPFEHSLTNYLARIDPRARTLAEVLRSRGYETIGLVANLVVSSHFGFDRGFDHWDQSPDPRPLARHPYLLASRLLRGAGASSSESRTAPASDMVDRAIAAMKAPSPAPRFLYLHLMDPHDPYTPPEDLARAADPGYSGDLSFTSGTLYEILRGDRIVDDADLRHAHALYEAEVAEMDREIARLLDFLRPRFEAGRVVVAFTADHGEEFMEHGELGHEHTLYQELIHVPLIVSRPGTVPAGGVAGGPARLLDVAPTILDLAGLAPEGGFHGRSLLPFARSGVPGIAPPIFSQEDYLGYRTTSPRMRAAREGDVKVILYEPNIFGLGPWRREAYRLDADPGERATLGSDDAAAAKVEGALRLWMASSASRRGERGDIDPETERRLRALGYIQ
jgi:arylsulfatase A-like enzyme